MSGLIALVLGLAAVAYAAWPWLKRRSSVPLRFRPEVRRAEELEDYVNALRDWSIAAGEVRAGDSDDVEGAPMARLEDD